MVMPAPCPGGGTADRRPIDRGQRQQRAAVPRYVRLVPLAGQDSAKLAGHIGVIVEAEHRVGFRQGLGQLGAVPLRQAADGDHRLGSAGLLEVGRGQQGVDRILLGALHETARVDHDRVGAFGVVGQPEAARARAGPPIPRSRRRCGHNPAKSRWTAGAVRSGISISVCRAAPERWAQDPRQPRRLSMTTSSSSALTSTSRGLEPSEGPTTPRVSRMSISRPALAKPTRSLRWSIEVEPSCRVTTSSTACSTRSRSSPMSSATLVAGLGRQR